MVVRGTSSMPLWLNIVLLICLTCVSFAFARGPVKLERLLKERHKTETNTSLASAWRTNEVEVALTEMGFNASRCKERHWKKYVPEEHREDGKYRRIIRRLCKRILLPNDADRLEAKRRYLAQVGRKFKFNELVRLLLTKLSEYNETQENILNNQKFEINDQNTDCYWRVYYSFSETCADPHFDFRVLSIRNIFANACSAAWLDVDKIIQCFKEVCPSLNLYE